MKDKECGAGLKQLGVTTSRDVKPRKDDSDWSHSTFTYPPESQRTLSGEKPSQIAREAMLRKELAKFRSGVERKFRHSEANRTYRFPRQSANFSGSDDPEDIANLKDRLSCVLIKAHTASPAPAAVSQAKTKHDRPASRKAPTVTAEYFSTTARVHIPHDLCPEKKLVAMDSSLTSTVAAYSQRQVQGQNSGHPHAAGLSPSAQFFIKVRGLLHTSTKTPRQFSSLLRTTNCATARGKVESPLHRALQANKLKTKQSTSESKRLVSCRSEVKMASSGTKGRVSAAKFSRKTIGTHNTRARYAKPGTAVPKVGLRGHVVGAENWWSASTVDLVSPERKSKPVVVKKNPEYFELQGRTIDSSAIKSPQGKNRGTKTEFDMTKFLSTMQGKENSSSSASIVKVAKSSEKVGSQSPSQGRARQAISGGMHFPFKTKDKAEPNKRTCQFAYHPLLTLRK